MREPKSRKQNLNILFIASEADPLVKAGGLGDVAGALPAAIQELKTTSNGLAIDIRLAIPYYNHIKAKDIPTRLVKKFQIQTLNGLVEAGLFVTNVNGVITYMVSGEPVSRSDSTYGIDFKADAEKFVFFSLACLRIPSILRWNCAVLHANDWHTAVALHKLPENAMTDRYLKDTKSVLTIHNLPFMGTGAEEALSTYRIDPSRDDDLPDWGKTLPLPMGLAAADRIVAVSPTYAKEILTPEYGCDLQDFLKTRPDKLGGILNGIDIRSWDPATDPALKVNFDRDNLSIRRKNKTALLDEFQFASGKDVPLLVLISRMDRQKGVDIIIEGLRASKDLPWKAILLGTGDHNLEQACKDLEEEMPQKVKAAILFDVKLSRRMYAGADILLMPSRYEPCGLSQMYAMRYGCLPLARATGGLVDTIFDPEDSEKPTGFLFTDANADSFTRVLQQALRLYKNRKTWRIMQTNAMAQDFSWECSARKYLDLYTQLINISYDKS